MFCDVLLSEIISFQKYFVVHETPHTQNCIKNGKKSVLQETLYFRIQEIFLIKILYDNFKTDNRSVLKFEGCIFVTDCEKKNPSKSDMVGLALGNFAVGNFAVGNFPVGNFAVRKFRPKQISP